MMKTHAQRSGRMTQLALACAAGTVVVGTIGGCSTTKATKANPGPTAAVAPLTPGPDGKVESRVLTVALRKAVLGMIVRQGAVGEPLPADAKTPEFMESVVTSTTLQHPEVFRVTPDQEKAFAAGEFDDAANGAKLKDVSEDLKARKPRLTAVEASLLDAFRSGTLKGADLELATRMLSERAEHAG